MVVSKRAKNRIKLMSVAEKKSVSKSVRVMFDNELIGVKRMTEIMRVLMRS